MRTKSEEKRQTILDIAAQVFREAGFERASMSEICARVGGSKATLYSYFPSKEELFFESMHRSTEVEFDATHKALDASAEDIAASLRRFGEGFLTLLYSAKILAVRRLIIAESERSQLGSVCYARGPLRSQALISQFLESAMQQGKLRQADPMVATLHLRGLLEAELLDRFQFQIGVSVTEDEIKAVVARAVDAFMAAYGPLPR